MSQSDASSERAFVGVDVGGTHTDVQVVIGEREARGKSLTTYDDFSRGVLNAIEVAAQELDLSLRDLLARTHLLFNATTVVTNAITQLRGSKVGVLVTTGFKDEFLFSGGARLRILDEHLQTNAPQIVDRRDIREVGGRIDFAGKELAPIDEGEIEAAIKDLVENREVEALAICFLSSYNNPAHEKGAAEISRRLYPDLFVTASHEVSSVRGEYPRWMTAILNSFVYEDAKVFLDSVSTKLVDAGLGGSTVFFQGLGGGISRDRALRFPLALLGAGPAGGATGANELAKRMGYENILLGDMGGTSFDTGLIHENKLHIEKSIKLDRFRTVLPLVDVVSVGAGGGSIAWISERGAPQVGPRSAGSTPGPAAYGNGGTEATVTDAMVAMDFIDVDNYLGGRLKLHKDLAEEAVGTFGEPLGWGVEEAAAAIHDLVVTNMANAVREVSVNKGFDPRDFVFLAYGGTLPWFAVEIARALQIATVVVPRNSSVFCAQGLLSSDYLLRSDQTVQSTLASLEEVERVNSVGEQMVAMAMEEMEAEGFSPEDIDLNRGADFQFAGQVHALSIGMPNKSLAMEDIPEIQQRFTEVYERTYGEGTAWPGAPQQLLDYTDSGGVDATRRAQRLPADRARASHDLDLRRDEIHLWQHDRRPGDHRGGRHDGLRTGRGRGVQG
jgi:N-methylhydantoinase A